MAMISGSTESSSAYFPKACVAFSIAESDSRANVQFPTGALRRADLRQLCLVGRNSRVGARLSSGEDSPTVAAIHSLSNRLVFAFKRRPQFFFDEFELAVRLGVAKGALRSMRDPRQHQVPESSAHGVIDFSPGLILIRANRLDLAPCAILFSARTVHRREAFRLHPKLGPFRRSSRMRRIFLDAGIATRSAFDFGAKRLDFTESSIFFDL